MSQACEKLTPFSTNYIAYDGECPMCNAYVRYVTLKGEYGFQLVNLRENRDVRQFLKEKGYDLNQGMIAYFNGQIYYGDNALHIIALLSDPNSILKKLNKTLFSSQKISKTIYPWLVLGRRFLLRALNRKPL